MKPINNILIVKQHNDSELDSPIIIIPSVVDKKQLSGVVVYAGDKAQSKPGDVVIFNNWAYSKLNKDGEDLLIINEDNVSIILKQIQNDSKGNH